MVTIGGIILLKRITIMHLRVNAFILHVSGNAAFVRR